MMDFIEKLREEVRVLEDLYSSGPQPAWVRAKIAGLNGKIEYHENQRKAQYD
jgi:hypothetical protein